jgi:hypothetical protein
MKREKTPEEKMTRFVELLRDEGDDAERAGEAGSPTEEELDRQLAEAGLDVAEVNASIEADRQDALRKLAESKARTSKPRRRLFAITYLLPIAAAFAGLWVLQGPLSVAWLGADAGLDPNLRPASSYHPEAAELARAATLRAEAADWADAGDWKSCAEDLDLAASLDPAGDRTATVRALRARVLRAKAHDSDARADE